MGHPPDMRTEFSVSDELFAVLHSLFPSLPDSRDPAQIAAEIKTQIEREVFDREGQFVALSATDLLVCKQLGLSAKDFLS